MPDYLVVLEAMRFAAMRLAVLLAAPTIAGPAQDPAPVDSGVVIRSTTSLVQVRVIAEDRQRRPVGDLKLADFQVFDNRRPQPITLFSVDRIRPAANSQVAAPPPASAPDAAAAGYAIILFDWLNTDYTDRLRAQDSVLRLLHTFQPRQRVALYILSQHSGLLHDFTTDLPALEYLVQNLDLESPDPRTDKSTARVASPAWREQQILEWNAAILDSLGTLNKLADRLSHIPGRKHLIWMSSGFPMVINGSVVPGARPGEVVYVGEIERALAKLNSADVAVYSVDPCGLSVKPCGHRDSLMEFAERTGGAAYLDRNDTDVALREAFEDMGASYVLGFHLPPDATPGLHELHVKVSRPHVQLRYRESYQVVETTFH
ncbi:MAG TPA: VWA domain-containing protein [Bryobacteraceae bacterium]|nr:VWA domain-containing protein [Bryobacteraceae bacterium]